MDIKECLHDLNTLNGLLHLGDLRGAEGLQALPHLVALQHMRVQLRHSRSDNRKAQLKGV